MKEQKTVSKLLAINTIIGVCWRLGSYNETPTWQRYILVSEQVFPVRWRVARWSQARPRNLLFERWHQIRGRIQRWRNHSNVL